MENRYRINEDTAYAVLEAAVTADWSFRNTGGMYTDITVAERNYRVATTEDQRGQVSQLVVHDTAVLGKSRTIDVVPRTAFAAKRLAHLKAQWDAIEPEPDTIPWYNKWAVENVMDPGRPNTIRRYENCLGVFQDLMAEQLTLEQAREGYADYVAEMQECLGHESLDGAHMGESVYCDGTCRTPVAVISGETSQFTDAMKEAQEAALNAENALKAQRLDVLCKALRSRYFGIEREAAAANEAGCHDYTIGGLHDAAAEIAEMLFLAETGIREDQDEEGLFGIFFEALHDEYIASREG